MAGGMTIQVPDDEGDLVVTDTNEAPRRRVVPNGDDKNVNDVGFGDLKAQLDKVTRQNQDNELRAANAEAAARRNQDDAEAARRAAAAASSEAQMATLESEYAAAFEAGDSKKLSASQRRMSELGGEIAQLRSGKAAI